jgi:hypothetical protein
MIWKSIHEPWQPEPSYFCPCCKYKTLHSRGDFETCKICFWEDDGQDEHDAEIVRGGPNHDLSLQQAQDNYATFGAIQKRFREFVRPPREGEERELK